MRHRSQAGVRHTLPPEDRPTLRELHPAEAARVFEPATRGAGDCSSRAMSTVHILVNAGYADDEILRCAQDSRYAALFTYATQRADGRSHTRQSADKRVTAMIRTSRERRAAGSVTSPQEARQRVGEVRAAIEVADWPGRAGLTDLLLLRVLSDLATAGATITPSAPVRRMAELLGCSTTTVAASLRRCQVAGWLARDGAWSPTAGQRYRLCIPTAVPPAKPVRVTGTVDSSHGASVTAPVTRIRTLLAADAFAHQGLGRGPLVVLVALEGSPGMTAAEVVRATGRHQSTVYRALARLAACGLATEQDGRWAATCAPDLAAVADALGTTGTGDARRRLHSDQRVAYLAARGLLDLGTGELAPG